MSSLMAMSPGLLWPRNGATVQRNSLVCRDHGELVKSEEIVLPEKRDRNKEHSGNCTNSGSIKVSWEQVINILREIKGEVTIHKTRKMYSQMVDRVNKGAFLEFSKKHDDDSNFKRVQNKCLAIKSRIFFLKVE